LNNLLAEKNGSEIIADPRDCLTLTKQNTLFRSEGSPKDEKQKLPKSYSMNLMAKFPTMNKKSS
jgi:hypothetical protein